ncbi:MAG: TCR/Tet family MFS transporter [Acidobacteria bacterium]|nr:TCR/Tet family MFS transporter [Acidobacteriota bacterium]
MTDSAPARAHGKNAFLFVVVAVTLNMLAFGIVMPIMPSLLAELTGLPVELAARENGWLAMTYAIANFIAMPFLGALSDRFGRRPVLLVSIAMLGVDMVIMGLAPSVAVLFLGRALAGFFSATVSVANAYVADVTEPRDRGRAFGMLGAAFGLGFILGPVFGGLLGEIHIRLPFFVAAVCAGLNFLYGLFVMPESLAPENRRPLSLARANPFGAVKHFSKLPRVYWFIITIGVFQVGHAVYPSTWNYYGAARYGWSEWQIGLSLGAVGIGSALSQALLTGIIIKRLGAMRAAVFGLAMNAAAMALFAFASQGWMVYAILFVSALGGVAMPSINTITSNLTPPNAQGELQGAQSSLMAFTLIFSPVLMTQVFAEFAGPAAPVHIPGAAFLLAASFTLLALLPLYQGIRANRAALTEADI